MKKESVNDYIRNNYSETTEGITAHGTTRKGCYRVEVLGDSPSECHCHVDRVGNELKYICFGAKCGIKGVTGGSGGYRPSTKMGDTSCSQRQAESRQDYNLPNSFIRKLSRPCSQWLEEYSISEDEIIKYDVGTDQSNGRLILPIRVNGEHIGYTSRRVAGNVGRKWYNIVPKGTIFSIQGSEQAIIVENPISAIKMHNLTGCTTIALLGHILSTEKERSVREALSGAKKVFLFLDPDVEDKKLFKLKKGLTRMVDCVTILKLNKKPKDVSLEEIEGLIK